MPCERCYDLDVACVYQPDNRERCKESQYVYALVDEPGLTDAEVQGRSRALVCNCKL